MQKDLHHNIDDRVALNPQAISTNTTTAGAIIDTSGYESIEFLTYTKAVTDGTYTVKLEEGDDAALSDAAVIASDYVLGTLPALVAADDNAVARVGCLPTKRYVRLSLVSTGVTTGVDIAGALAVLGNPANAPVAQ